MDWNGAYTALVTPFAGGGLDAEAFVRNVQFQNENGIAGMVVCGTTGESPTLSIQEKRRLFELLAERGTGIRIAGTGGNNTAETASKTAAAQELGYEAALLVDCYYNGPSSMELRQEYYSAVAGRFPELQLIPYVIPGRSGCELAVEDLAILAGQHANITAVKEATGNLERMRRTRQLCGSGFAIFSGDDDKTLAMLADPAIRAAGVISVASNVVPKAVAQLCSLASTGDVEQARQLNEALSPLFSVITVKTVESVRVNGSALQVAQKFRNPLPYKVLMNGLGIPAGPCRQPLGRMSKAGVAQVRQAARITWERNPELLEPLQEFYGVDIAERIASDAHWSTHYG
ncbi:MAG: 4-hydroxy-tetrahydrodipicolinate synthase [Candidatus Aenigmarchaeota archaeon]|nr:4-hydroxy-tetrahydrodipicolinate synthase [Candidatus Aenigmarchaeota archaeon]